MSTKIGMPSLMRRGVVDLGSNSVRLVVYEGFSRNPVPIFNEKAVLRLGRGLDITGRLNEESIELALTVMHRYHAIAQAMAADPFEVLATAAVRDAINGKSFIEMLQDRLPSVPIHILSGVEEAHFSADGMLCGIPLADGILADIGGGSLELVRLERGQRGPSHTLRLGVIRLAERADADIVRARAVAEADLQTVPWIDANPGGDLYLVGGAFRALARIHIAQTNYPLAMVHHYTIARDGARDLAELISTSPRKLLEKLAAAPRRRLDDLPFAAVVLRRLLRLSGAKRVIFSASGLREGWFMRRMPPEIRLQDPLIAAARELAARLSRDPTLPPALLQWTAPLFPVEAEEWRRLREAACWMSDVGSHDHPEYRAEQAFLRILRQPGVGLSHQDRAYLALTAALRYEADIGSNFLAPARVLLNSQAVARAEQLGSALRLAYTLSAGTRALLAGTRLHVQDRCLNLRLRDDSGVFAGESVMRRLNRVAQLMGLTAAAKAEQACGET